MASDTSRLSLLYIEDDPTSRNLCRNIISRAFPGLEILAAGNGEEGLELYKAHQPDIILSDICMPVMDGIQMAQEIRALNPDAPIIFITAMNNDRQCLEQIKKIGCTHVFLKPTECTQLIKAIRGCITSITQKKVQELTFPPPHTPQV